MNWILLLFIALTVIFIIAWLGKYRPSIVLFNSFLLASLIVFLHHLTDKLPIHL